MGPSPANVPHALYRFRDADGQLLYVGITLNPLARWGNHRGKPWWHEVAAITIQVYVDRAAALSAEATAISSENPRYNVRLKPSRPLLRPQPGDLIANGDPADIRAGLSEAGERRAEERRIQADAMDEITVWLRRGQGVLSITEMSRLSGVTRETIYQILRPTNPTPREES